MKLIGQSAELKSNLLRCSGKYSSCAFATAWASAATPVFQQLIKLKSHVTKGLIGTHFYQTHPDVLDSMVGVSNVRFILQPNGVFHPKIYLFWTQDEWEALLGSANLTQGAMSANTESMLLISSAHGAPSQIKDDILSLVESYWPSGEVMTQENASRYRAIWNSKQVTLKALDGQYGESPTTRPPISTTVMSMTWDDFFKAVKGEGATPFQRRCDLLGRARQVFQKTPSLVNMTDDERRMIAGLPPDPHKLDDWFGSMKPSGSFMGHVKKNNIHLSDALDLIPTGGIVSRVEFESYIREYQRAFRDGRHGVPTATRLITLKRPDQFLCLTGANQKQFCKDVGIKLGKMDYGRYWSEVVERIRDAPWWNSSQPKSQPEMAVWQGRAAMLDAILYRQI